MRQPVSNRERRRSYVYQGSDALKFVVPGSMEQVAESDHPGSLTGKIRGKTSCAAAESSRHWVQLNSASAQVRMSYGEIRGTKTRDRNK
ncbi:MAG: hypothetical protein WB952_03965 [Terriglobales bacterium]